MGTDPHPKRFLDFAATSRVIRSKGLSLGLWVSDFRDLDSRDLAAMPDARSLPAVIQSESRPGLAMSFTTPWRHFCAQDLVALARRYLQAGSYGGCARHPFTDLSQSGALWICQAQALRQMCTEDAILSEEVFILEQ